MTVWPLAIVFEKKRIQLGFSQDEVAERIDRAPKYCSDIERGTCGMSTETMLAISDCLDISLDYMYVWRAIRIEEAKTARKMMNLL